jgi:hypothetical protein
VETERDRDERETEKESLLETVRVASHCVSCTVTVAVPVASTFVYEYVDAVPTTDHTVEARGRGRGPVTAYAHVSCVLGVRLRAVDRDAVNANAMRKTTVDTKIFGRLRPATLFP